MPEHFQTGPCRAWGTPDASPPYLSLYLSLPPSPLSCPSPRPPPPRQITVEINEKSKVLQVCNIYVE